MVDGDGRNNGPTKLTTAPPKGTQFGIAAPRPASTSAVAAGTPKLLDRSLATSATVTSPEAYAVAEPAVLTEPGAHIHQYELIRELGRGGMGVVWAARDTKLGRRVAIKFLLHASRGVAERFLTEARATAQCSHDNIVIIHEVDEYEDTPYMVLEFLEGQPLRGVMGASGSGSRLPASRVVELALPIARALARAHELGIVHRDLKPDNVFVTTAGQVKVLDFGIAKALGGFDAASSPLVELATAGLAHTREGALVGTLPYMSPEQMGTDQVDHRSDLWALGIIMFEMLAGRHPVEPLTIEALLMNAGSDDPLISIRQVVPDASDGLAAIIDGCLQKKKVDRIARASDIVRRLEEQLPGRHGRQLVEGESPYPGLTAFQESDADRFFGRSRDIARMVARIRELPITGIIGPSGVGKSSFIRAGVGPALKASGERWEIVTLRPGRQPVAALASIVQRLTQTSEHDQLAHRLRSEPGYMGSLLRDRARQLGGNILLFVDQFEELYTLVGDPHERRAFTAALTGIADDTAAPLRVVVSMRSDFLDRISEDPRFTDELSRGFVFLSSPDRAALREALVAPIEMVGHHFETSAMVEDMLDALVGTSGALPLLQFAAAKLWDARDRQRRLLTVASYDAIGGISGALATHADDVVAQMTTSSQALTHKIFRQLVTPERTRALVELADLRQLAPEHAEVTRVVEQLVAARLLVVQTRGDTGGGSVEIVHESLIERWPKLRRWLDEAQEDAGFIAQLSAAAKQWETKGRPAGLLWRGDAMEEASRWHAARPRELHGRDRAFLDAVFGLARRGKRARRTALVGAFVLMGSIAAGAMVAFVRIRGAEQQASENFGRAEQEGAKTKDALDKMQHKERERLAAEARQATAEQQKAVAESARAQAQAEVQIKTAEVEESRDELKAKNVKLETALKDAERQRAKAEKTAVDLEAAKTRVEQARAAVVEENKRLKEKNETLQKLTTRLKGM